MAEHGQVDPEADPFGLNNPHRGGCKMCKSQKRVISVPDAREPGYFLIRICDICDRPS